MNINQISDLETRISNIEQLDIETLVATIFSDQDIESVKIGQFSVPEYVSTVKRLLKQFNSEFTENGHFLPFQYNYQNEFGNGNLQSDLQNLASQIGAKTQANLNSSVALINRLVYYQIANGFWDKSTRKIHKPNEIKIVELKDQLDFIAKQLKEYGGNYKNLIDELAIKKEELQNLVKQKNQELQQIANNLQTANSNTNQIAQLLNNSTSTNEKINGVLNQQNQNLDTQKKKGETQDAYFKKQSETFTNLETSLDEKIKEVENQIADFKTQLEFVEGKREFFEERNNYLDELIGREVGASLFETFKQRKTELEKPVSKWLWIVIAMAVLTFGAILIIFTNALGILGDVPSEISTIRLITNSIKTLPFFFLLFYAVAQYNKERNFQEEYAFKSAVALTIKAYSDIIKKDELKDELIVSSVSGIFKSPTIYKTKKTKEDNTIMSTAKDLLNTALEVMKKK
jgi:hydroxymethylpyrimidine/phosphomethylpyrimidine kinase